MDENESKGGFFRPATLSFRMVLGLAAMIVCLCEADSCLAQARAGDAAFPEVGFGTEPLDAAMRQTLKQFGVPGGALAVTDHGKLVVAKGYGWANIAAHQPVTPESLFCLASVSKVVTGVAVLRLVEEGKLKLDDRMYVLLGRPRPLDGFQLDPRVREITVRQLLLHAGGFDPKQGGDYLQTAKKIARETGQKLPISADFLLRYAFSRPLDYMPGKEEHYSNFGFFLLNEVIEKVSGQPYEQYVRQHVLRPSESPAWNASGCGLIIIPMKHTITGPTG